MTADVQELLKAALAGRYTLEKELGRGGMATVQRAGDLHEYGRGNGHRVSNGRRIHNRVFVYHNGAESYYASRAFRGSLRV